MASLPHEINGPISHNFFHTAPRVAEFAGGSTIKMHTDMLGVSIEFDGVVPPMDRDVVLERLGHLMLHGTGMIGGMNKNLDLTNEMLNYAICLYRHFDWWPAAEEILKKKGIDPSAIHLPPLERIDMHTSNSPHLSYELFNMTAEPFSEEQLEALQKLFARLTAPVDLRDVPPGIMPILLFEADDRFISGTDRMALMNMDVLLNYEKFVGDNLEDYADELRDGVFGCFDMLDEYVVPRVDVESRQYEAAWGMPLPVKCTVVVDGHEEQIQLV